ncbi:hypothetical protein [Brunnivagina elsteri]|uniref:hypothetical protein n=1 Tax=Brunnivagina elsteri TaxID=1247191 RepID=UPI00117808C5|nr:hypothetical protein [Calothrix elsteri]
MNNVSNPNMGVQSSPGSPAMFRLTFSSLLGWYFVPTNSNTLQNANLATGIIPVARFSSFRSFSFSLSEEERIGN